MADPATLTDAFEAHRTHLRSVAYRMLGSLSEADDAVQETWIRVSRAGTAEVENLGGWLTTVTARICLNTLRSRRARPEEAFADHVPEPIVDPVDGTDPEHEALLADSVGLALLVVLDTLSPAERLSFVLHDMFAVPFDEIAAITDRTPAAARQLASRARRRVRGAAPVPDPDLARQQEVVEAFMAASRDGDFERLVAVLDPDVVLRAQTAGGLRQLRGAAEVAGEALFWSRTLGKGLARRQVLVNGAAGVVAYRRDGSPVSLMGCTVVDGRIVAIDIIADRDRLAAMDIPEAG
ncbi:MAG: sigma-70 family RNA polymerase sigma factor [Thermoleophilia bacterium]